jgi:protein ImuA
MPPAESAPAALSRPALADIAGGRRRALPAAPFLGTLALARGRVHEFCGPARRTLALMAARGTDGGILWIRPGWLPERLHPEGVWPFADPGRLVFVTVRRIEDMLWCAEEALRSAALPLVVADLPAPPGLTPVRRLQLAAEAGAAGGRAPPLGLLLAPGEGGAAGAETRWHAAPAHAGGAACWRLTLARARAAPAPRAWTVTAGPAAGEDAAPDAEAKAGTLALALRPDEGTPPAK